MTTHVDRKIIEETTTTTRDGRTWKITHEGTSMCFDPTAPHFLISHYHAKTDDRHFQFHALPDDIRRREALLHRFRQQRKRLKR